MKHIKALFAWVLVLTFLCVGCKVQPLSMRTGGESAAIGAQPTFEDLAAEERTVTDGELFRAQFEGTAVEGSAGVVDGKYRITATKTDGEAWHVKLEANYPTVPGNDYRITYTFTSDVAGRVKFGDIQESMLFYSLIESGFSEEMRLRVEGIVIGHQLLKRLI